MSSGLCLGLNSYLPLSLRRACRWVGLWVTKVAFIYISSSCVLLFFCIKLNFLFSITNHLITFGSFFSSLSSMDAKLSALVDLFIQSHSKEIIF